MSILVISDPATDAHLLPVLGELGRRGHDVHIFNPGAFPGSAVITVDSTPSGPRSRITWEQQTIDLAAIGSIWFRRPGDFGLPEELLPGEAEWLRVECSALINGIYANTDALWVSAPHRIRRAELKLLQLSIAQRLGFRVPAYTVTNDPQRARSFLAEHPTGVIVKALFLPTIHCNDRAGMLYTHRVAREDEEELESVRYGPTFLQSLVPKARDIRVTVIGEELFAAGIESMSVAEARIDVRRVGIMDLPHKAVILPEPVAAACRAMVRELGLRFGAIDLLETPDGDYVFLEINPNGQWYWVEMITGQPMARAMADLLERGERERGRNPGHPRAGTLADRAPHVLSVGEHTIPLSSGVSDSGDGQVALANLTATRAWFEKKQGEVLLHVGDVENGPRVAEIAPLE